MTYDAPPRTVPRTLRPKRVSLAGPVDGAPRRPGVAGLIVGGQPLDFTSPVRVWRILGTNAVGRPWGQLVLFDGERIVQAWPPTSRKPRRVVPAVLFRTCREWIRALHRADGSSGVPCVVRT